MKFMLVDGLLALSATAFAQQGPGAGYPPPPPPGSYAGVPPAPQHTYPKFTVPVISATPAYRTQMRDRQVCDSAPAAGGHGTAGTVIGGVAGGLLGNQVGKGNGRTLATVAGALGGALAGNAIGSNVQSAPECRTVSEQQQVVVGYDVVYDFSGQRGRVTLPSQPGPTIVVEVRPSGF